MRVADRTTSRNYLKYVNKATSDYAETNLRIASGNRFTKLSDDVSAGTRVLNTRIDLMKAEKQLDTVGGAIKEVDAVYSSMMAIEDILTDLVGEFNKAATATLMADRNVIAENVSKFKESIVEFANLEYANKFPLGGSTAITKPFTLSEDGYLLYNGVDVSKIQTREDGTRFYLDENGAEKDIPLDNPLLIDIGLGTRANGNSFDAVTGFEISFSGLDIFGFGMTEDGKHKNVINIINELEKELRTSDKEWMDSRYDEYTKYHELFLEEKDVFIDSVASLGSKRRFLESMETRLTNQVDNYKFRIDDLMGIDDAEEATNQSMNDYILKAVIQMGSKILPVSLWDYLR